MNSVLPIAARLATPALCLMLAAGCADDDSKNAASDDTTDSGGTGGATGSGSGNTIDACALMEPSDVEGIIGGTASEEENTSVPDDPDWSACNWNSRFSADDGVGATIMLMVSPNSGFDRLLEAPPTSGGEWTMVDGLGVQAAYADSLRTLYVDTGSLMLTTQFLDGLSQTTLEAPAVTEEVAGIVLARL
ncbi:MAG: hypothetical protein HRU17_05150 [Polyangiaceae bacterium]|nr:hypothetical protein [Polyangiaceae bacterium]